MTTFQKIAKWFANRRNEDATFAEICEAFPEIKPKTISSVLSKKFEDSNGILRFMFPVRGPSGHFRYFLNPVLPIYSKVENLSDPEEVEIEKIPADEFFANVDRACEGDCSHCEADTCVSKDETPEDKAETNASTLSLTKKENFSMKRNKYYTYVYAVDEQSEKFAFCGKRIAKLNYSAVSPEDAIDNAFNWLKCKERRYHYFKLGKVRIAAVLAGAPASPRLVKTFSLAAEVKTSSIEETETKDKEEEEEAKAEVKTLDFILEVLRSIDKHLAQIAETESSIAKLFHQ